MTMIHPMAIIDPTAVLGEGVEIGPFCFVGPHCKVGDGTRLHANVTLQAYTTVGKDCQISPGAVLGGFPQDTKFKDVPSFVEIGDRALIRECVTVNRATGEGKVTVVGDDAMLMAYAHVAHNCILGNEVILANSVQLGGHVEIGDQAFIGGMVAVHQFVRIGRLSIIGGASCTRQDVPPFAMTDGRPVELIGINKVGLKRRGYDLAARTNLKNAFKLIWFSGMNQRQGVEAVRRELEMNASIEELLAFVESSQRGIRRPQDEMRRDSNRPEASPDASDALSENLIECL